MATRYYKLFDLLNRRGMIKSDLRKIISSATIAKLSKGEHVSGEVIEKICLFLNCQPNDIMEIVEIKECTIECDSETIITTKKEIVNYYPDVTNVETRLENRINDEKYSSNTLEEHLDVNYN